MEHSMEPASGSPHREAGVMLTRTTFDRSKPGLAEGVEWMEEVVAGGDTDAVGQWARTVYLKNVSGSPRSSAPTASMA